MGEDGRVIILRAGGRLLGLPLRHVHEVLRPGPITAVPGAPAFVAGATLHRGDVIPVVDVAALLDGAPEPHPTRLVAVALDGGRKAAVLAAEVLGVRDAAAVEGTLPPLLTAAEPGAIVGLERADGALLTVLRATRLVPEAVWQTLAKTARTP